MSKKEIHQTVGTSSLQSARVPGCPHTYAHRPKATLQSSGGFLSREPLRQPSLFVLLPPGLVLVSARGQLMGLSPKQRSRSQGGRCSWRLPGSISSSLVHGGPPDLGQQQGEAHRPAGHKSTWFEVRKQEAREEPAHKSKRVLPRPHQSRDTHLGNDSSRVIPY